MPTYELRYFPLPGRAESSRLAFAIGGIPFTDTRIAGPDWRAMKESGKVAPTAQMPTLTVDGEPLSQSMAILRYVGKIANYEGAPLYPQDPWVAAHVDEVLDAMDDLGKPLSATFAIQDQAEKEAKRAQLVGPDGPVRKQLAQLDERLGKSSSGFAVGNSITIADIRIFIDLRTLVSGFLDGVPRDCLDAFASIKAHGDKIASLPPVAEYYSKAEGLWQAFKPSK